MGSQLQHTCFLPLRRQYVVSGLDDVLLVNKLEIYVQFVVLPDLK